MSADHMVPPPPDADFGALRPDAFPQGDVPGKSTVIRDGNKTVTITTDQNGHTTITKSTGGVPPIPDVPPLPGMSVDRGFPISGRNVEMMSRRAENIAYAFFLMCAVMVVGWPLARALLCTTVVMDEITSSRMPSGSFGSMLLMLWLDSPPITNTVESCGR